MAEDRSVPYMLAAHEIPAGQPPDGMDKLDLTMLTPGWVMNGAAMSRLL